MATLLAEHVLESFDVRIQQVLTLTVVTSDVVMQLRLQVQLSSQLEHLCILLVKLKLPFLVALTQLLLNQADLLLFGFLNNQHFFLVFERNDLESLFLLPELLGDYGQLFLKSIGRILLFNLEPVHEVSLHASDLVFSHQLLCLVTLDLRLLDLDL